MTLFPQNRKLTNTSGAFLDYGFGSANNSEFLLQHMKELHGIEVSESSVKIANNRLAKYKNFNPTNFVVRQKEQDFAGYFDIVVAWHVLYYNTSAGLHESIENIFKWLRSGGMLIRALIAPRDVKVKHAKLIAEDACSIDQRVPHQEGCIVFSPKDETEFLGLFKQFEVVDYDRYERVSFFTGNTASESYLVARKR